MSNLKKNDGGAAFPQPIEFAPFDGGMRLRDYFAAQIMNALCQTSGPGLGAYNELGRNLARIAYDTADDMISERNKPNSR